MHGAIEWKRSPFYYFHTLTLLLFDIFTDLKPTSHSTTTNVPAKYRETVYERVVTSQSGN